MERVLLWALCAMKGLSDGAKRTFLVLLCYSFGKGECWPSTGTLASKVGCGEEAIRKHVRALKREGLIDTVEGQRKHGKPLTLYHITFTQERALEILTGASWALFFTCGIAKLTGYLGKRGKHKVRIPKAFVMSYPEMGAGALITLIMLWSLRYVVTGYLDNQRIAGFRGVEERTVENHLAAAEAAGICARQGRRDPKGRRLPNRIIIGLPSLEKCLRTIDKILPPGKDNGGKPQVDSTRKFFPRLYIRRLEGEFIYKFVFSETNVTSGSGAMSEGKRGAKAPRQKKEISLEPGDEKRYGYMARDLCEKLGDEKSYGYFLLVCKACYELDGNHDTLFYVLGLTKEVKNFLRKPGAYFTKVMNNRLQERGVELISVAEAKRRRKERSP